MRPITMLLLSCIIPLALVACAPTTTQTIENPQVDSVSIDMSADTTASEELETEPEPDVVAQAGGTIARALTTEPSGLDPHGPPGSGQNILLPYLFDTLVYRDAENQYHPFLAESWEVAEDGTSITFNLRQDVTFHDGTPLNAEAVVANFSRFMELGSTSPVAGGLKDITELEAVDAYTVRFHFDTPSSVFFGTISMPYAGILSPAAVEKYGEEIAQHPVGTGPFMLSSWQPGVEIVLERNPVYAWGPLDVSNKLAPHIDQAVFKVIPDASTQLAAFEAGEVDVIFINQPNHIAKLKAEPSNHITEAAINSLVYLGFNAGRPPFDDVQVRQALSHAVNKEDVLGVAVGGVGKLAFAPLASTLPGFDPALSTLELAFDPEQAEALLVDSGYSKNDSGIWEKDGEELRLTLLTSTRAPNGDIATVLQNQFAAIGVPIDIQQLDARAVLQAATAGEYDLLVWRYGWNDADVLNIYLASDRIGSTNRSFYSNAEVDELLNAAMHELDSVKRAELYASAQKLIMADAPWVPLYEPVDVIAVRGSVEDVIIGPMGRVLLNDARVSP